MHKTSKSWSFLLTNRINVRIMSVIWQKCDAYSGRIANQSACQAVRRCTETSLDGELIAGSEEVFESYIPCFAHNQTAKCSCVNASATNAARIGDWL